MPQRRRARGHLGLIPAAHHLLPGELQDPVNGTLTLCQEGNAVWVELILKAWNWGKEAEAPEPGIATSLDYSTFTLNFAQASSTLAHLVLLLLFSSSILPSLQTQKPLRLELEIQAGSRPC